MSDPARALAAKDAPRVSVTPSRVPQIFRKCACADSAGKCGKCSDEEKPRGAMQRKAASHGSASLAPPPIVSSVLSSPGHSLDTGTRSFMESRFGHDFSGVRIHTGPDAAASAHAVGAHAYTVGNDIVFGSGKYDPQSPDGQRLLAHELTHTIQQRGVQLSAIESLGTSTPGDTFESEADAVANAIMSGGSASVAHAAPAVIARQGTGAGQQPIPGPAGRAWTPLPTPLNVGNGQRATHMSALNSDTIAFRIDKFNLPTEKGPVADVYTRRATEGALESTITIESGNAVRAGLWQHREPSAGLRDNWLLKVGWPAADAGRLWHESGGPAPATGGFPQVNPRVTGSTCDMDHIVELQLGGVNIPSNIQTLNSEPNQASGRAIWEQVRTIAQQVYDSLPVNGRPREVMLHFDTVNGGTPAAPAACAAAAGAATSCTQVELCAQSRRETAGAAGAEAGPREEVTLVAGGADAVTELRAVPNSTMLYGDTTRNVAASELVPGAIIRSVARPAGGAMETAEGCLEIGTDACAKRSSARRTRIPIALTGESGLHFNLHRDTTGKRHLRFRGNPNPNVAFTYPYLSQGSLRLSVDDQGGVTGTGTLRPSIPLLSRLNINVNFAQGSLNANVNVPPERIRLPFPGARITRAELGLDLAPEFRPYGLVAFAIGPAARPVIDGSVTAEADANGLVLRGDVFAHIPGVDNAQGHVEYRNRRWSGFILIESSQIRLPHVQRGSLRADFNDTGYALRGGVVLALPGGNEAELSVRRRPSDGAWIYTGRGRINVPSLNPVEVEVSYDGTHVTATGRTGITIAGLQGDVALRYRDGRVTGEGTIAISRPRATGSLTVRLGETGRFSGTGTVRYQVTPTLIATAGIELREDRTVRLSGALEFPQPIPLFRGINERRELFRRSLDIPIFGISIGPVSVGLIGRITGAFGVTYGVGPGELRNARIAAAFNPLDENPDLDLQIGARLVIPAHAGVFISIRGAIGLSAAVASVTGGITATGTAELRGGLEAAVDVRYQRNRFSVDAFAEISAAPAFRLSLDADVTAEAGVGPISYQYQRVWHLAGFEYGSNLRFGLRAPIHYASDEAFRAPTANDIQWIVPEINVSQLVGDLAGRIAP